MVVVVVVAVAVVRVMLVGSVGGIPPAVQVLSVAWSSQLLRAAVPRKSGRGEGGALGLPPELSRLGEEAVRRLEETVGAGAAEIARGLLV